MHQGNSGKGLQKHRKSGVVHNCEHFTGKKGGKQIKRKGSTKKQRRKKHGTHQNKYALQS
jgi:hypothetical protein